MFGGRNNKCHTTTVRTMQLFHELKQRFPTIPDHVVTACIASHLASDRVERHALEDLLLNAALKYTATKPPCRKPMGRPFSLAVHKDNAKPLLQESSCPDSENTLHHNEDKIDPAKNWEPAAEYSFERRTSDDMNECSDANPRTVEQDAPTKDENPTSPKPAIRPNHLDIKSDTLASFKNADDAKKFTIQPSEKCKDVHKLLNSTVCDKPPRSPLSANKRFAAKSSPTKSSPTKSLASARVFPNDRVRDETQTSHEVKSSSTESSLAKSSPTKGLPSARVKDETHAAQVPKSSPTESAPEKRLVNTDDKSSLTNARVISDEVQEGCAKARSSPAKSSPTKDIATEEDSAKKEVRKETCSTPTQTTDTLLGSPNVNVSLNVNCSLDLVQSPQHQAIPGSSGDRRTSLVQFTPSQPWLQQGLQPPSAATTPRSYTSVNFTLRTPTSAPQDPIDITSQNSSLTYSTSSFDSQKGLQSRLQITVGPAGGGSVSSVRVRPRSFHLPEGERREVAPARAESLGDLAVNVETNVILKQQAGLNRLYTELINEKAKLERLKEDVVEMENLRRKRLADKELEKQLLMEIRHLRSQCKSLQPDDGPFYNNIYTGPRVVFEPSPPRPRQLHPAQQQQLHLPMNRRRLQYQPPAPPQSDFNDEEGPKWNCAVCTFLNHPDLNLCEQCSMPRILHVSAAPGDNIHIHVTPRITRRITHSWVL
ncbi:unnamed protein product [Acanthoscelides obtectus]|uniref:RanBP2-type domain-containing protein n=1 Tax=Acanthoscelides obtectus TaxID=200917 RepID=A0A9P0PTH2_ACAOB|nr:unnamed protein product [Acanthoscelides obtectus]CAK1670325.1 TGF-beta-activated kinase 1 and MAP3K7-binding protein 2 [Acanthoscelides obtectus]